MFNKNFYNPSACCHVLQESFRDTRPRTLARRPFRDA